MESRCYRLREVPTPWSTGKNEIKGPLSGSMQTPLLPGVDATIILTMGTHTGRKRSGRLMKRYGTIISRICPKVYFQINQGFKRCSKRNVHAPPTDLLHALLQAFRHAQGFRNVLILEDDAVFEPSGLQLRMTLLRVGRFIVNRQLNGKPFNTYNLGAVAHILFPCGKGLNHRRILGFRGCAQAIIWSREARNEVLRSINIASYPNHHVLHADNRKLIPQLESHAFTYKTPIVTQLFVETDNSQYWSSFYENRGWRRDADKLMRAVTRACIQLLRLDKSTQPGWNLMYGFGMGSTAFPVFVLAITYALISAWTRYYSKLT